MLGDKSPWVCHFSVTSKQRALTALCRNVYKATARQVTDWLTFHGIKARVSSPQRQSRERKPVSPFRKKGKFDSWPSNTDDISLWDKGWAGLSTDLYKIRDVPSLWQRTLCAQYSPGLYLYCLHGPCGVRGANAYMSIMLFVVPWVINCLDPLRLVVSYLLNP